MHWVWDAKEGEQQGRPSMSPMGPAQHVTDGATCMWSGGLRHVWSGEMGGSVQTSEGFLRLSSCLPSINRGVQLEATGAEMTQKGTVDLWHGSCKAAGIGRSARCPETRAISVLSP